MRSAKVSTKGAADCRVDGGIAYHEEQIIANYLSLGDIQPSTRLCGGNRNLVDFTSYHSLGHHAVINDMLVFGFLHRATLSHPHFTAVANDVIINGPTLWSVR